MKHFAYFPKLQYGEDLATDIMVRARVREMVLKNAVVYYSYTVKDGEKPETIAYKYYGSVDSTWLVLYANEIFDPIWDWVLDDKEFNKYIVSKYGSIQAAHTTVDHYELTPNGLVIDQESYNNPNIGDAEKTIVSCYEQEQRLNEAKRSIKVIDKRYRDQIINEMKRIFNS
jgi:hypothetical protein